MSGAGYPGSGRPIRPQVTSAEIDIDLHGMTVSVATWTTERHIANAHASRLHIVKINHGHGTGALKTAVKKLLKKSPLVKRFRAAGPADGGDGVTIAELDYGQRGSYDNRANNSIVPKPERRK